MSTDNKTKTSTTTKQEKKKAYVDVQKYDIKNGETVVRSFYKLEIGDEKGNTTSITIGQNTYSEVLKMLNETDKK